MIIIIEFDENTSLKRNYVKCPSCKTGRLCDKPSNIKAKAIPTDTDVSERVDNHIILKCPKCAKKFTIHFLKENT